LKFCLRNLHFGVIAPFYPSPNLRPNLRPNLHQPSPSLRYVEISDAKTRNRLTQSKASSGDKFQRDSAN